MTDTSARQATPDGHSGARVVVGVDGSPDSIAALRAGEWAAAARGGTLVAVTAYGAPMVVPRAPFGLPDLREAAAMLLHEALIDAFHGRCVTPIETVVKAGGAAAVLVEQSQDAGLLVVGSRGHGGFAGLLVGSVSMSSAMHASCPVLVLHSGGAPKVSVAGGGPRVVVGVGGGSSAVSVLRVAARAAAEMDAELLAVAAWENTLMYPDAYVDLHIELEIAARRSVDVTIAEAFPGARPPRLRSALRKGTAARVLVEESKGADLVVVGRRGHSELEGLLLGSVALAVAEYAQSPVLVVPLPVAGGRSRRTGDLAAAGI